MIRSSFVLVRCSPPKLMETVFVSEKPSLVLGIIRPSFASFQRTVQFRPIITCCLNSNLSLSCFWYRKYRFSSSSVQAVSKFWFARSQSATIISRHLFLWSLPYISDIYKLERKIDLAKNVVVFVVSIITWNRNDNSEGTSSRKSMMCLKSAFTGEYSLILKI